MALAFFFVSSLALGLALLSLVFGLESSSPSSSPSSASPLPLDSSLGGGLLNCFALGGSACSLPSLTPSSPDPVSPLFSSLLSLSSTLPPSSFVSCIGSISSFSESVSVSNSGSGAGAGSIFFSGFASNILCNLPMIFPSHTAKPISEGWPRGLINSFLNRCFPGPSCAEKRGVASKNEMLSCFWQNSLSFSLIT